MAETQATVAKNLALSGIGRLLLCDPDTVAAAIEEVIRASS